MAPYYIKNFTWLWPSIEFNHSRWLDSTLGYNRHFFVKDLLKKKTLNGLTKNEMIDLLGSEYKIGFVRRPPKNLSGISAYHYEITKYMPPYIHYLEIYYSDENPDIIIDAKIVSVFL
jgi:hypothetical protein